MIEKIRELFAAINGKFGAMNQKMDLHRREILAELKAASK